MARDMALSGMRMPIVRRFSSALSGTREDAVSTNVKGPGRFRFRIRNAVLSTRQYSATWAISPKTTEKASASLPFIRRRRSMALGEWSEQPKA